jgi:hypothetical protein
MYDYPGNAMSCHDSRFPKNLQNESIKRLTVNKFLFTGEPVSKESRKIYFEIVG